MSSSRRQIRCVGLLACLQIWQHHRACYHDCGCTRQFIDFPLFDLVCNIALPCAVDSAAINLFNRCMPATEKDYLTSATGTSR